MSPTKTTITRRALLSGLAAGAAQAALAAPPAASPRPMPRPGEPGTRRYASAANLVERAKLGAAKVGFVVADVETGTVLETMNPVLPLPPASVAKALTAVYGLDTLGPDFRFTTRLVATGPVEAGVLKGDLILDGSGDPTLDTDRLAELVAGLKAASVMRIDGDFLLWDGALPSLTAIDPGQPDQVGYNPGISGLNLNFNRVHFEWRRDGSDWQVAMDARSAHYRPDVRVARMEIVPRRYPVYTYEDGGDADLWTVARGALGKDGSRWLPVRKPTAYTGEVFQTLARAEGVVLPAPRLALGPPEGIELARVQSKDLRSVLQGMLKYSTNITAEAIGLSATARRSGTPPDLPASAAEMSGWIGTAIGRQRPALVDHSGLGGTSRLTATDMVRALVEIGPAHDLEPLMKQISMKDSKGRPVRNHPVKVFAKTGTLNFVSNLAGYTILPGGRRLAFATFVADVPRHNAIPRENRERPPGVRSWTARARTLQMRLIDRWSTVHTA